MYYLAKKVKDVLKCFLFQYIQLKSYLEHKVVHIL